MLRVTAGGNKLLWKPPFPPIFSSAISGAMEYANLQELGWATLTSDDANAESKAADAEEKQAPQLIWPDDLP
ncbi:uncharacterized protein ANIA_11610 [Aspergillus nidulans FGSC A4]|uniref:Uncharacterized protein n=1 Tax=Emericella nidulans (strain FGSC A4 / ATCC 38163 / CBS 112.46 / NRRL 194 / M139) TaxID=227321 RepID=C8VEC4_EMENI|nr:hypothetical protein [Aspergillus nidulans FGSC A4]CBF80508.1 TPA: hypothetical protein ANIA_11610 [Aspergillus nidulans FGSC A4]